jgi:DNA-directed RNA polymerase subunit omega
MARITVEDCIQQVPNRFELVRLAAVRTMQLVRGAKPLMATDDRETVTALREIAAGRVRSLLAEPQRPPTDSAARRATQRRALPPRAA